MSNELQKENNFPLRMSSDLKEAVRKAAEDDGISMNKFIVDRLRRSVKRNRKAV